MQQCWLRLTSRLSACHQDSVHCLGRVSTLQWRGNIMTIMTISWPNLTINHDIFYEYPSDARSNVDREKRGSISAGGLGDPQWGLGRSPENFGFSGVADAHIFNFWLLLLLSLVGLIFIFCSKFMTFHDIDAKLIVFHDVFMTFCQIHDFSWQPWQSWQSGHPVRSVC